MSYKTKKIIIFLTLGVFFVSVLVMWLGLPIQDSFVLQDKNDDTLKSSVNSQFQISSQNKQITTGKSQKYTNILNLSHSFYWQLSNYPVNIDYKADVFDVDLFETPKSTIDNLHQKGKIVVCYINFGSFEPYRPDKDKFPKEVLGKSYQGWEDEIWLNIAKFEDFKDIMFNRIKLAKQKGCDGIEPDNIQNYEEDTGFNITNNDQLRYNRWIAKTSHNLGIAVALKNDSNQVNDLVNFFDFAIIEDCYKYDFCEDFTPFISQGKPVFMIEYTDTISQDVFYNKVCKLADNFGFYAVLAHRDLDGWQKECR